MRAWICALVALPFIAGCAGADDRQVSTEFHANGVDVVIEATASGTDVVVQTTFDPGDGWHLYSTDLAMTGIEGIGRPTRVDVVAGLSNESTQTQQRVSDLDVPALGIVVPVYPDGPVVLTTDGALTDTSIELAITYMACSSDGGCRVPVVDRRVVLELDTEKVGP